MRACFVMYPSVPGNIYYIYPITTPLEFENSEMIWVEIEFPSYKVLLCVVYRSPGATQSFWQNFEYSIEEANVSEI
jgi:hypothetical protein